jgi:hypothetical protein
MSRQRMRLTLALALADLEPDGVEDTEGKR